MWDIFIQISLLVISLALLVKSADRFIECASKLATMLDIQPITIGILVIGLGTSAPEIMVALISSIQNKPDLAIGNVVGSNIANIALVLGSSALIAPLTISRSVIDFEIRIMLGISILAASLLWWNQGLDWLDGVVLLGVGVIVLFWLAKKGKVSQVAPANQSPTRLTRLILWTLISLLVLVASAQLLVYAASNLARIAGLSEMVIGLSIVAIGTSLPELAAALAASFRKQTALIVGNIIGSNIFNLVTVLPLPALLASRIIPRQTLSIDLSFMLVLALSLPIFMAINPQRQLTRFAGFVLISSYLSYLAYLMTFAL